jgi:hypothetical protein
MCLTKNAKVKGIGEMLDTLGETIVMIIIMGKHIVRERMNTFLF